jgi:hypothetical protein
MSAQKGSSKPQWRPAGKPKSAAPPLLGSGAALSIQGRSVAIPSSPTPRIAVQPKAAQSKALPLPPSPPPPPPPIPASPVAAPSPIVAPVAQLITVPEKEPDVATLSTLTVGDVIAMIQTADVLAPVPAVTSIVIPLETPAPALDAAIATPEPAPALDGFVTIIWADLVVRLAVSAGHVSVSDIDDELALRAVFPRCDIELTKIAPKGVDMRTAAWDALEARDTYGIFFGLIPDTTYFALVRENEEEAEKEELRRKALRAQTEATLASRRAQSERQEALLGADIDAATSAAKAALDIAAADEASSAQPLPDDAHAE